MILKLEVRGLPKYNTRQRTTLLAFLEKHADETLSARQIADALNSEHISVSAVYRNLSELNTDGLLRTHNDNSSRETLYQYTNADCCKDCLHLSCKKCGKTFHMDKETAQQLTMKLDCIDGFSLDKRDTVLYGVCERCKKRK